MSDFDRAGSRVSVSDPMIDPLLSIWKYQRFNENSAGGNLPPPVAGIRVNTRVYRGAVSLGNTISAN